MLASLRFIEDFFSNLAYFGVVGEMPEEGVCVREESSAGLIFGSCCKEISWLFQYLSRIFQRLQGFP